MCDILRPRRSFAPEPNNEVSPQENNTDIPQENCLEQMDIDKEEMAEPKISHLMQDSYLGERKDFKKRVRAKHKEYHAGLKQLKKDQEREWKTMLINKDGSDYSEYLQPEDKEFLEKVHNAIEPYRENVRIIKEQKEQLISIEHFHKILLQNNKLLEDLRQQESNAIRKIEFLLPA